MSDGWVKLHRAILDHPRATDPGWLSVWVHLLMLATHKPITRRFGEEIITLSPGQLITSRKSLSERTGVHESAIQRILSRMSSENQIEQRSSSVSRLITIVNWADYQQAEQRTNSERTAGEQPPNSERTLTRIEEQKNERKGGETLALFPSVDPPESPSSEIKAHAVLLLTYLNEKAGRRFVNRLEMIKPIIKRLAEGNPVEEMKLMIDREIKVQGPNSKWLQPTTLFGKNFYGHYSDRSLPICGQPTLTKPPTPYEIRKVIENKEGQMLAIKRKHYRDTQGLSGGQYVPAGWQDEAAKAEYAKLKEEVKTLNQKLNQQAAA